MKKFLYYLFSILGWLFILYRLIEILIKIFQKGKIIAGELSIPMLWPCLVGIILLYVAKEIKSSKKKEIDVEEK